MKGLAAPSSICVDVGLPPSRPPQAWTKPLRIEGLTDSMKLNSLGPVVFAANMPSYPSLALIGGTNASCDCRIQVERMVILHKSISSCLQASVVMPQALYRRKTDAVAQIKAPAPKPSPTVPKPSTTFVCHRSRLSAAA